MMKAINTAYKSGDFARLLELEQQQTSPEEVLSAEGDVERQCQQLVQENQRLRDQYEGIKAELRQLRNSTQEGMMVKTHRKAAKEGIDFVEELLLESEAELSLMK